MSIAAVIANAGKFLGAGSIAFEAGRKIGGLLGLGGDNNIARNLSADLGCTIPQDQAAAARSFVARGINPCTMQPLTPEVAARRPEAPKPGPAQPVATTVAAPTSPVITVPPGGGGVSVQAGIGGVGGALVRATGLALAPGILRTATGRISSIVLPSGQRFSRKRAAALIRRVGLDVASVALGIGIIEAAEILLAESKPRRRRGITHRQIASARRVACMVSKMARDLNVKPAPRRTSTCR